MRSKKLKTTNGLDEELQSQKNGCNSDDKEPTNDSNHHSIDPKLNYSPKLCLRCHCKGNDVFDNSTNIWCAVFQPKTDIGSTGSDGNRFVATCGSNMVCIIDCLKSTKNCDQSVMARYIDANVNEEFTSLAYSVVDVNDCQTLTLAVGGKTSIRLMSDFNDLHCYEWIKSAHLDQINSLHFTSNDLLFSASYDKSIKLWRISGPNDNNSTQMLRTMDTKDNLLSLCYSHKYKTLIASGYKGVYFWSNPLDLSIGDHKQIRSHMKTKLLVDGLVLIPEDEDVIAIRIYLSKIITIIDLKKAIEETHKTDSNYELKSILFSKLIKTKLRSFDYESPFIYLTVQNNLLVSGGPNGQIWLYSTDRFKQFYDTNEIVSPDRVLEWPSVENIVKDNKSVIDDKKPVIVNTVAISPDLQYLIACTQMNLLCIWHKT